MPPPQQPDGGDYYDAPSGLEPEPADHFRVDRDTVLQSRAKLHTAANELKDRALALREGLWMEPCGPDPVSIDVARAVNWRLTQAPDSYYNVTLAHAENGLNMVNQLAETAREYGYTEDEIEASLRPGAFDD